MTPREFLSLRNGYHGAVVVQPVTVHRDAPILLFVIPFATTPRIYDDVIRELAARYSVKVLTAPEQAYRDGNFERIVGEQFEDWRREALGASAIVGWSLGGNLALAMSEALRAREGRCPELVLIDDYFCNESLKIEDFQVEIDGARDGDDYLEERLTLLKGYRPARAHARGLYIKAARNERSRIDGVVEGGVYLKEGGRVEIDADHFTIMRGDAAVKVAREIENFVGSPINESREMA
jgi:hypothetical protein